MAPTTITTIMTMATGTPVPYSSDSTSAPSNISILSVVAGCIAIGAMVAGAVIAYKYKNNTRVQPAALPSSSQAKEEEKALPVRASAEIAELPPLHVNIGRRDPWNKYVQSIQEFPVKNKRESWLIAMEELHTVKTWEFEDNDDDDE